MRLRFACAALIACGCTIEGTLPEPHELWPHHAAPQLDPSAPTVTVGIGSIVSEIDGTTESFGLYQYLLAHPIQVRGANVVVELVDIPAEATYAVSGRVAGSIGYVIGDKHKGAIVGGFLTMEAGALAAGLSLIPLSSSSQTDHLVGKRVALAGGALAAAGFVVLEVGQADISNNHYAWDERAQITFRYRGQRIDDVQIRTSATRASDGDLQGVHDATLAPVWEAIRTRLARRIETDLSEGRS